MGTTAKGYPYPEDSDPVAQGAQAIKALATKIDSNAGVSASGSVSLNAAAQTVATVAVTFPVGRFTAPPSVVVGRTTATSWTAMPQLYWSQSVTATGCQIAGLSNVGSSSIPLNWTAVQAP
jgi:hypothetical protein